MKTVHIEVNVPTDRRLTIELPDDVETGTYQVVLVMNPVESQPLQLSATETLNNLAGQVTSFADIDAVTWQRKIRDEWDDG
jgi:hypothetical protein